MDNRTQKQISLATVILAYNDYESLELSLAVHSKFFPNLVDGKRIKIYILQNGRGSYDCERTFQVAKRYERLFPEDIEVIDWIKPRRPYLSLRDLFKSKQFEKYTEILKLDDDVFPLTSDWMQSLSNCYKESKELLGEKLAYVTSLVNNNPWGFKKTLTIMGLEEEYFKMIARPHFVGDSVDNPYSPFRLIPKDQISTGGHGTIWGLPYIARWLHMKTTLQPDMFIKRTRELGFEKILGKERYSINCMLFKKDDWFAIDNGGNDDELMWQQYCIKFNKNIVANLEVPMCHLFFFTQRFENKDLMDKFREVYSKWLDLPFPISLNENRVIENEARLKFLEEKILSRSSYTLKALFLEKCKNTIQPLLAKNSLGYKIAKSCYRSLKKIV